ncbi:ATP-binding protein [Microbacterium sp. I2]|jgi:DNA-binding CsgD family transcriptional regulator|uniref:ATP-binding protein n=1 Tax=Microbacterium sp. I2 TaxID=3391826 RepID=UPI003ED8E2F0
MPHVDDPQMPLLGREHALGVLQSAMDRLFEAGSVILIEGDAGVGKTAVLDHLDADARARGFSVLRGTGVEAEADVPAAALHQMLHGFPDSIAALPAPQRDALRVAFGELDGAPPTGFLLGLAALTILSERAVGAGLVVIVDDLHWVDAVSAGALAVVARRIANEPILLVVAARSGTTPREWSESVGTRVTVAPLDAADSTRLVESAAPSLTPAERDLVMAWAQGNPLALIELSASRHLRDGRGPEVMTLTSRLEQAFSHKLEALDDVSRAVLLVAAVSRDDDQRAILDAAGAMLARSLAVHDLAPLVERKLISSSGDRVVFTHPLIRSAAVHSATPKERTHAHRAVAALLPRGSDRALWHLAVVADEPDEDLARAITAGAGRLAAMGAMDSAIVAYTRAAELTDAADERARRLLLAAETAWNAFRLERATSLLSEIERVTSDPVLLARAAWIRQLLPGGTVTAGEWESALASIEEMSRAGSGDSVLTALSTLAFNGVTSIPGPVWQRMIRAADQSGAPASDPRLLQIRAFGAPRDAAHVEALLASVAISDIRETSALWLLSLAAMATGSISQTARFCTPAIARLKSEGRLTGLGHQLVLASTNELHRGEFRAARRAAQEASAYGTEARDALLTLTARLVELQVDAVNGAPVSEEVLRAEHPEAAAGLSRGIYRMNYLLAVGVSEASCGRFASAFAALREIVDANGASHHWQCGSWGLAEFVDAAARCGQLTAAAATVAYYRGLGSYADSERLAGQLRFAEAVLASVDREDALLRACDPGENPLPYTRARASLFYGQWLRGQGRVTDARPWLRQARDALDGFGAHRWAGVARAELAAAGERSSRPKPDVGVSLTPQEERIVRLAADGLSNREIAEALFLSPRTVGAHLYSAYPKLGVSSRGELRSKL